MPYIINDEIFSPFESPPLALIQDIDVAGNFMVLRDIEERDNLNITKLRVGMIVRTMSTNQFWKVENMALTFDENWEEIYEVEWSLYDFGGASPDEELPIEQELPFALNHANFTVSLVGVPDCRPIAHTLKLQCYSFFLLNLKVSQPAKVEIFSRKDLLDITPYTFIGRFDHLVDNGDSLITKVGEESFKINTSAYSIIANEDDILSRAFYFRVTPMLSLTENGSYAKDVITVAFDYVTLET